ncbi:PLANT INVERTASE/PECTIN METHYLESTERASE INHIBITOR SUPERFAMILY PROTEIN [Salix viminalis]|uniref:PLANT INVERTASE/PECTIN METHYLESTERASE INHIBITOR SUPERFAMILY PROTEIN n=1 Tax=Salix viminalis TaxID=40686 RepID=A0A6N2L187_SALVM|nr:PLANT INVERTASE/PECTIN METHYLESTERASE INHIBITOR SUPERFAMILY PROTEIN [Salix viminalis]
MASFIHRALFLVLFSALSPILFGTHSHVKADDSLIKLQCRNSETPALCIQCIHSDPAAPQADKVGIAAIVINCLRSHSRILASNMTKMASREDDERLRSAYQSCSKGFLKAVKHLLKVVSVLKMGDYDKANAGVMSALEYELSCGAAFEESKRKLPGLVVYEMRVYEALSEAAFRIIDRF